MNAIACLKVLRVAGCLFSLWLFGSPSKIYGQGALFNGGNFEGQIAVAGESDTWTFVVDVGDRILLRSGTTGFAPLLRLYSPASALLRSGTPSSTSDRDVALSYDVTIAGTYSVVISANYAGGLGSYNLQLAQPPKTFVVPSDDEGGALANGENQSGVISLGDMDLWTVTAAAGETIVLRNGTQGFVSNLRLYSPTGALVTEDWRNSGDFDQGLSFQATATGTYTVVVSAYQSEGTGTYILRLAKSPGLFVVPSGDEGGALSNGESHAGVITLGDVDLWTIAATAGETIVLRNGTQGFVSNLRLYSPTGSLVTEDWGNSGDFDQGVTYQATATGTYTVLVSAYQSGGAGTYLLRLAKTPGVFSVPSGDEGGGLSNGESHAGVITLGDVDLWTIAATAGETIILRNGTQGFVSNLRLYSPTGSLVTEDWGNSGDFDQGVTYQATATGTYTVLVSAYQSGGVGTYLLRLAKTPGVFVVPEGDEGGALSNGGSHAGAITMGDVDFWTVTAATGDTMTVRAATAGFVSNLRLYSPTGMLLVEDWGNSGDFDQAVTYRATSSGTYTVIMSAYQSGGSGTYTLRLAKTPGVFVVPGSDEGGAVTVGGNQSGTITLGDMDIWTITAVVGETMVLRTGTQNFVANLRLYGPAGDLVGEDWGNTGDSDQEITFKAKSSGTYTLFISAYQSGGEGTYTLRLLQPPREFVVPAGDDGGLLRNGGQHDGTIALGDLDGWTFAAAVGDNIFLRLTELSGTVGSSPKLQLYGPDGALKAQQSGGTAAVIDYSVALAGTYTVVVCGASSGDVGTYRLKYAKVPGEFIVPAGDEGGALTNGAKHNGYIDAGDFDLWTVNAAGGETMVFLASEDVGGSTLSPYLRLYAPEGALVGTSSNTSAAALSYRATSSGVYTLVMAHASGAGVGAYSLTLASVARSFVVPDGDEGGAVSLETVPTGTITRGDLDMWTFSAVAGDALSVRMDNDTSGSGFVPGIVLFAPDGVAVKTATGTASASLVHTATTTGRYTVLVLDNFGTGAGTYRLNISGNTGAPAPLLVGGTATGRFTGSGQRALYELEAPPGGHLRITLDDLDNLGANEIYLRRGGIPNAGTYDYRFSRQGADQSLLIPNAGAGTWYILVVGATIPAGASDYTLGVQFIEGAILQGLSPGRVGNTAPAVISIEGAGFAATAQISLRSGASTVVNGQTALISGERLTAYLDVTALAAGVYELTVTQGTTIASLPLEVVAGGLPKLETELIVPSRVGRHAQATIFVEYANTGDVAMPAPLLVVRGSDKALLTLDTAAAAQGLWTSTKPKGFGDTVQILASGDTPGILQPGERKRVPVMYVGLLQPWDFGDSDVQFDLGVFDGSNTSAVDWSTYKDQLRPSNVSLEAWEPTWANFVAAVGPTWGDYSDMLADNATYLGRLGFNVTSVGELLAFELAQADGLNPVRALASATDASVRQPGLGLVFSRVFPQPITQRHRLGSLGRGWSHNWEYLLEKSSSGDVTIIGPAGVQREFQPDSRGGFFGEAGDYGKLTATNDGRYELREKSGLVSSFNSNGRLEYVQDLNGNRITAAYVGNVLKSLTHSAGQSLQLTYSGGLVQSVADSYGRITTYTYDSAQHLTSVSADGWEPVQYSYTAGADPARLHALTTVTYPGGTHDYFTYDARGRLTGTSRDAGANPLTFTYDEVGTVIAHDATMQNTSFFFDHRGLLARISDPLGNEMRFNFDRSFNLTSLVAPDGAASTLKHDMQGNTTNTLDPLGQSLNLSYGTNGRLTRLTDGRNQPTNFTYNPSGDLTSMVYPDASAETYAHSGSGDVISTTNRRGQTITVTRDSAGRITRKQTPEGRTFDFVYDARGRLTSTVDSLLGTTSMSYDARDLLTTLTYPEGRGFTFTYDAAGRRTKRTSHDGYSLHYFYDSVGRLARLDNDGSVLVVAYSYDANGRLDLENKGNGTSTSYEYDVAGNLLHLVNRAPDDTVLSRFDYTYDANGNRTSMATLDGMTSYRYDLTSQLTGVTYPDGRQVTYAYDAAGNRTSVTDNGITTTYTTNNLNQYTKIATAVLGYDSDGNLTHRTELAAVTSYNYNSENQLIRIVTAANGTWEYTYDAFGNRVAADHNGQSTIFLHDPVGIADLVAEYRDSGLVARYDHGIGLVACADAFGASSHYNFDGIGNTRELTDSSGNVVNRYNYDPFGMVINEQETVENSFSFSGRFGIVSEIEGVTFMRARTYAPALGRFMSVDPSSFSGGDPNLQRFAMNNPVNWIDVTGLEATPAQSCPAWISKWLDIKCLRTSQESEAIASVNYANSPMEAFVAYRLGPLLPGIQDRLLELKIVQGRGSEDNPFGGLSAFDDFIIRHGVAFYEGFVEYPLGDGRRGINSRAPISDSYILRIGDELMKKASGGTSGTAASSDPNELIGPAGYGAGNYLRGIGSYAYRLGFENDKSATAPAQIVEITNAIPANLDLDTLEFTSTGFGDWVFPIAPGSQNYEHTEVLTIQGTEIEVTIEIRLDRATREVRARFSSLMPLSGLPPPVEAGFLPPENGSGRGMGHVGYLIKPVAGLATGTEIRNIGSVTFDRLAGGPTFRTDLSDPHNPNSTPSLTRQALVTIDASGPQSAVTALPAQTNSASFNVVWSGTDAGAGIASYDIYVRTDGGSWTLWLDNTAATSAVWNGQIGHAYAFYSVATDGAGLSEIPPSATSLPQAVTTTEVSTRLVNIATRAYGSTGNNVTIGGFVVSGSGSKRVLVRAVGPTLTSQGIGQPEVMLDPTIEVHDASHGNVVIATNDNWGDNSNSAEITTTASRIGAAALLGSDTKSSALLLNLSPGVYSFVVNGRSGTSGIVLLEVYDADAVSTGSAFVNIATRAYATTGNGVTIGGFVISGNAPKRVLLRGMGPTLTTQGIAVPEVLSDPIIELHDASHDNAIIATNDNWGDNANAADILTTAARIGATPFASSDTKSSALLTTLQPGVYSFVASGKNNTSGVVLVEVYDAD